MSVYASRTIQVNLSLTPGVSTVANFGTPLFFGFEAELPSTPTRYTSLAALAELGLAAGDPTYDAVSAALAQSSLGPRIQGFFVAKRSANVAQISNITYSAAVNSAVYTASVTMLAGVYAGETYEGSYTAGGSATMQQIVEGVAADLNANLPPNTVEVTEDNTKLILTAEVTGAGFTFVGTCDSVSVTFTYATPTANVNGATQIPTLVTTPGWYALVPVGQAAFAVSDLDIQTMTATLEAYSKFGMYQTATVGCLDSGVSTDPMSLAQAAAYNRALILFEETNLATIPALAGRWLAYDFSTALASPQRMQLAGITVNTGYDDTDIDVIAGSGSDEGKNGNIYANVYGVGGAVFNGRCPSGVFARDMRGLDGFIDALQTSEYSFWYRRSNQGRPVVATQADLEACGQVLRAVCDDYTSIGLFQETPVVGVPKIADLDADELAAGRLAGFTINGTRANEFIDMVITGNVG